MQPIKSKTSGSGCIMQPIQLQNDLYSQFARAQPFMPKSILGLLAILKLLYEEFLCWCTNPVQAYLRSKYGARGISLFQTLQLNCLGVLGFVLLFVDPIFGLFLIGVGLLTSYHRIEALRWEKNHSDSPRYSYSEGEPSPRLWNNVAITLHRMRINVSPLLTNELICRFWEPAFCLLFGACILLVSKLLGLYLLCCSVALLAKGHILHMRLVNIRRDQSDAQLFARWMMTIQRKATGQGEQKWFVAQLAVPVLDQLEEIKPAAPAPSLANGIGPAKIATKGEVRVACGKCKKVFFVNRKFLGRTGKCRKCGASFTVTEAADTKTV